MLGAGSGSFWGGRSLPFSTGTEEQLPARCIKIMGSRSLIPQIMGELFLLSSLTLSADRSNRIGVTVLAGGGGR